ncbi:pilus assembly protein N-terminal domain-containing protein [Sandaracinus amylolyticus]|uniref:pilus assembly protein N-terminal domain-containing protein n=1 Tax=Sandaracinus amylolyticus TaxID=927083 RepID=UPI0012EE97FB|nr:pilus assembly protein N-terminal domain-containing protein [Sandaracinus amylolyticus]
MDAKQHLSRSRSARLSLSIVSFLACAALAAPQIVSPSVAAAQARPETERLELQVGEQVTIPATGVASYSEGRPGIVDVRLPRDGAQFVIVALQPGVTSLLLIYADGRQVRYAITVLDPEQSVTATGGVPARENIRLDLYFVQLQQSYSHQLGLAFPGSIGGAGIARVQASLDLTTFSLQSATATITNQALPRLDLAQASGWARLLRQAMLVTANGQEAEINSGGEVNIVVSGGFGGQIQRIEFGSNIEVTPRYDPETRRIEVAIQADVSDLTEAGTSGVPGRTRTQLSTVVNLELGQSIVLGGLVSRTSRESQGGLPGLSQIPIVGVLFGTNQRADENVENLLFIVPTVVQAVPRAQSDRIAEALRIYERFGSIGGPGLGDIELIEPSPPGYE